ncbi:DNA-binding response OmpR family regulator [Candidatus Methylobacter favarea]|uniref:DNA-binding response OmpR family regulator n=1 Tax=Candidatus Methylobacter favarea TaxID=2707345 RepID=A0A8S0X8Y2_9GAMM|nr:winged helix-turn-helix domain-containing protein [Candidatus Methylobacter favarea]CAA9891664.1 DNA-binding response OmpR family regulator [Candidatus Methylobacter favarea]
MTKDEFRIAIISDNPFHLGLLKGYCYVHNYTVTAVDAETIGKLMEIRPDLIVLALDLNQDSTKKIDLNLVQEMSILYKIPVCCLRNVYGISEREHDIASWIDEFLDPPLAINQLDDYIGGKFSHLYRFKDQRNQERRVVRDRRNSAVHRPDANIYAKPLQDDTLTKNIKEYPFTVGPFQIDQRSKCVFLYGKTLDLTRKEFELFELLAKDVERVLMVDEIIQHLWPINNRATKSDLYQYMHLLRKKIEKDPNNPQWILTIKGFGYKLNVSVADSIITNRASARCKVEEGPFDLLNGNYVLAPSITG